MTRATAPVALPPDPTTSGEHTALYMTAHRRNSAARRWFTEKASSGDDICKVGLATILRKSNLPAERRQGLAMLRGLAAQEHSAAEYHMALIYSRGSTLDGIARDEDMARHYLARSARQGFTLAAETEARLAASPDRAVRDYPPIKVVLDFVRRAASPL